MGRHDRPYETPATVAELHQLSPHDPAVLALERPLPDASELPALPGAPALWSEEDSLSDMIRPAYSPGEVDARLRAAAAAQAALAGGDPVLERLAAVEAELAELRRRSVRGRLRALLRRLRR